MGIISYAQNFEDVMLWRALGHVREGRWIDVGATGPDRPSVTRAFADHGWRGINLAPVPEHFARLCESRPRDITLNVAAGNVTAGNVTAGNVTAGRNASGIVALAEICRQYVTGEVHFLRIAVDGTEREVLLGADFTACRPWIVLVAAARPETGASSHAAWEPILLDAGYRSVWFDALNRLYVAGEHAGELARHFLLPPNVHDGFSIFRGLAAADARPGLPARPSTPPALPPAPDAVAARTRVSLARDGLRRLRGAGAALAGRLRSIARLAALGVWMLVRPVARPLLWRLRGFLTSPVMRDLQSLHAGQQEMLRAVTDLMASASSTPRLEPGRPAVPASRVSGGTVKRRVHQFHSGSATADAITNAMRLLRDLLRADGYASDIFVEHVDPTLAGDLLPLDALPHHDDYVLIIRHSMGHGAFERIAALPAPKLLIYHNITPSEFLDADPGMAAAAAEGRRQLAAWRDHVVGALADSPFNALELRALGYDVVLECPLLVDVEALRARAAMAPRRDPAAPFTVLFVGRIVESKAQGELIDAFAAFSAGLAAPCRLVLVGRGSEAALAQLRARAAAHALGDTVELPGVVSDDALHAAYAGADLYVSLSRHEGFGVPLVEAMAHGVPVLAWPAGAVPYTLGGAGVLLHDRSPAAVARTMLLLARDPARRAALAALGHRRVEAFALARSRPTLQAALSLAGAAPPSPAGLRAELAANLHITVAGHFNGSYSLAAVNRTLVQALEALLPGRTGLQIYEAGQPATGNFPEPTQAASETAGTGRAAATLAAIAARPPPATGPEVVICQHYPVLRPQRRGDLIMGLQFWEETLVPADMVAALSEYRCVLAPARSVAKALLDSGLDVPVRTVGFAPDLRAHAALGAARLAAAAQAPEVVTFLHVSSAFPRKGIDVLLAGWARAFRRGDRVRLVIKTFPNPHNDAAGRVAGLLEADPEIAGIELIDRDIDAAAMLELYRRADAMVLPTRGEGFNLPAAEAVAAGLRVIVTGWGGHMDFLDASAARLVAFTPGRSASHLASPHSQWAEPDVADLATALRETVTALHDDPAGCATRAAQARVRLLERMDPGAWSARVRDAALDLLLLPPPASLRLAWISTWMVACGVAEHSRLLLDHFVGNPAWAAGGPLVLCDLRRRFPHDSPAAALRSEPAWKLGGLEGGPEGGAGAGIRRLVAALAAEDPDVVMIQHQPGVLGWPVLAALLRDPVVARRLVLLTLHNTVDIEALDGALRDELVASLAGADRLLVHSAADVARLQRLGLLDRVTLLPTGAPDARPPRSPRSLPPEVAPVLGSFGFFLPGKGIPTLLKAAALLRSQWPGLRVRLVNARFPNEASSAEIAACRLLARGLGLEDAVEWHTDYLPQPQALDLLAGCDLLVLPYEPSRESASGAVRNAMASGAPVAVTPVAIFDEQGEAVARLPGATPEAVAAGIAALLRDPGRRGELPARAAEWLQPVSWKALSRRLQGMIVGLAETRRASPP